MAVGRAVLHQVPQDQRRIALHDEDQPQRVRLAFLLHQLPGDGQSRSEEVDVAPDLAVDVLGQLAHLEAGQQAVHGPAARAALPSAPSLWTLHQMPQSAPGKAAGRGRTTGRRGIVPRRVAALAQLRSVGGSVWQPSGAVEAGKQVVTCGRVGEGTVPSFSTRTCGGWNHALSAGMHYDAGSRHLPTARENVWGGWKHALSRQSARRRWDGYAVSVLAASLSPPSSPPLPSLLLSSPCIQCASASDRSMACCSAAASPPWAK